MTKNRVLMFLALGLLFFYLLVLQIMAMWPFTIDDMYISLRYAKHWEEGNGLLWNIGEPPVEGYSNFLYVCLAALALKLGLDPVVTLKMMGVVGLVLASGALYCLSRFWFSRWLALIPVLWLLFYRDEIVWVASGLETTIYQALLLFSVYALLRGLGYKHMLEPRGEVHLAYWIAAGVLLALAGLTRPEGGVVGVLFFLIAYFNLVKDRSNRRYFILGGGVFALIYGTYFLWRWQYYGLLLPNSVYCKGFAESHWLVLDKSYLKMAWPFLLLGFVGFFGKKNQLSSHDRRLYFLWTPSLIYLLFLAQADPVSAMSQRLFLPAFVFLLPLALQGLQYVVDYFIREPRSRTLLMGGGALWFAIVCLPISGLKQLVVFTHNPIAGEQLRLALTDWLKPQIKPSDRIVLADSGMLPYFIPARFEDSYCLNNKKMGEESYTTMFETLCKRTLQQKPTVIILASLLVKGKPIYLQTDQCLKEKLKLSPDYQKTMLFQTSAKESRYRYEIFIKSSRFKTN